MTPRVFAAAVDTNDLAAWATDIDATWYREGDEESNSPSPSPHILALLMHHRPPPADLLRTELLVIMGIMRTRLEVYRDHEIAPVCILHANRQDRFSVWIILIPYRFSLGNARYHF
jgi:hypothetical protein